MKIPVFSAEERADRLISREIVVQLLSRHSYYRSNGQRELELATLWVSKPENMATASLGYNKGYYVGMDAIREHYLKDFRGDVGSASMNTASTPLVFIADDGQTARYLGYRFGFVSDADGKGGANTYMDIGLIFADLILEDDEWKIWHLVLERDHTFTTGQNYSDLPVSRAPGNDPLEDAMETPPVAQAVYQPLYGWENLWNDMPKPYETYRPEESYGPEGNLGKPYYERERRLK